MDQDGFEESLSITQTMEVHNGKEGGAGLVGSVVDGKYRIIRRLGGGGMGEVYEAQHLLMKRRVALKLLHKHLLDGQDGEFLRRFEREAQTASQIEHPAAVAIYDFGVDSGVSYLAMQFNPGVDLKTLLAREGRLNPHRVMSFIEQIGSALSFAHRQGIVHRDLKPENIMWYRDEFEQERVQVLDFGLAKMVQEEEDAVTTMTKTGIIMGTPHYMSPEQIEARALDGRSDLYSLGVITYQLLVNRLPFTADSPMKVILMQLAEPPKPLKEANPDVNLASAVEDVVMKALAKKRDDRQVSVQAFVEELRQAIKGERSLSERHQVPKEFNVARARRSPWQMSVVASFLMVMVFFGAGVASNEVVLKLFPQWVHEQERIAEAEALGVEAEEAMERGDYRKAVHKLDLAAQLDTQKALWPYRLGLAQTQLLNYADAEVSLQQAIDKDPRFVSAHYELGNVYFRRGQFSQASKEFKTVLRLEPKHGEAKKNLQLLKEFDS